MPKLALIGCGAIAESFYLPALAKRKNLIRELILVDPDEAQLDKLKASYPVQAALSDYRQIADQVDGAIIATPPWLHHEMAITFLKAGIPVLCEKPLAEQPDHIEEMIAASQAGGAGILVNNTRRLFPNTQLVKAWISEGKLGSLQRIDYHEGGPFDWPTTSGFYFDTRHAKGVLMDRGPHVLDLLGWWLGETLELVDYQDDSFGGPEAVAKVQLRMGQVTCRVHLSWLNKLKNRFEIQGEKGTLVCTSIFDWRNLSWIGPSGREEPLRIKTKMQRYPDFANPLVNNFLDMISRDSAPLISAADVAGSIRLIDSCYANRRRFDMPWMQAENVESHAE